MRTSNTVLKMKLIDPPIPEIRERTDKAYRKTTPMKCNPLDMEVVVKDRSGNSFTCVEVDGYRVPRSPLPDGSQAFMGMPNITCRDDDVLLLSFPKTGTNWLFEILMMLLKGKAERLIENKVQSMLELVPGKAVDILDSPRVLNTHCLPKHIPRDVTKKGVKTVLIVRNPKDTAVSFYNHYYGIKVYKYHGKWEDWLPMYLNGECEYGTYENYLLEWEKAIENKTISFPLHILHFEDLKENGLYEIRRLASFLGVHLDDDIIRDIEYLCSFKKMHTEKKYPDEMQENIFGNHFSFFRKGEIGDWRNWFTLAQNDVFDELWNKRMKSSKWKFRYTPSVGEPKL